MPIGGLSSQRTVPFSARLQRLLEIFYGYPCSCSGRRCFSILDGMTRRGWYALLVLAVAVLTAVGIWKTKPAQSELQLFEQRPRAIMGTECQLAVVFPRDLSSRAQGALEAAERELRLVEARMSTYIENSEISRLNSAEAGETIELSNSTLAVLREALRAHELTGGAFDVTCRPLIDLWRDGSRTGILPGPDSISQARHESTWDLIELLDHSARKKSAPSRVDLGGIAKGYAIDRAIDALKSAGATGGLVNVGGDVSCFGHQAGETGWRVEIRHPSGKGLWKELRVVDTAVCTSGNYARFFEIGGRKFSHIVDPRSGRPATAADSVTVLARTALQADVWATALSVLGADGLESVPAEEGIEALVLTGSDGGWSSALTAGFDEKTRGR